ncbi:peroxiredoxin-2B-like [Actinidia eriantha]|uniref:peroxiredoxin-2B-like n=1 Tax=Actinidia eriantha TaxID=165200 RepID=UPI00258C6CA3|nr:peroxiredoxin-2B-like [Actinidia eriantha]
MAASVNNIAATFATIPITSTSSSSSSSSNSSSLNQTAFAHSISTSWNPHTSRPWPHKSSLLSIYGRPGPSPIQSSISTVRRPPTSLIDGQKLPNLTFSYLDRNSKIKTATLSSLGRAKRLVVVGVSAAFSPVCDRFVKRIALAKSVVADLIACVAVNDAFVMKAWGESLAVGEKVLMLSDANGELPRAIGVPLDSMGRDCGVRPRRLLVCSERGRSNG